MAWRIRGPISCRSVDLARTRLRAPGYSPAVPYFRHEGQRLAYTVHGEGTRTTVLMPGLLLSQKMQTPLARELAARGNRVVTFDPLGHGESDRPRDMWRY